MAANFETVFRDVRRWAEGQGIRVEKRRLKRNKAGQFVGPSISMNSDYPTEETVYYLTHALGSIVRWSLSQPDVQAMFDELRSAKDSSDAARLEQAIERYRAFEIESSEFAVAIFTDLGHAAVIPSYTNFMRADLEALTQFHRTGQAPIWREFFAAWNAEVAAGRRQVEPYQLKPIPAFTPQKIETQEILQEQG